MSSIDLLYQTAVAQLNNGEPREACGVAQVGLHQEPHHAGLWEVFGLASYELEALDQALNALETATTLGPLSPPAQLALAELYTQRRWRMAAEVIYLHLAGLDDCPPALMPAIASGLGRTGHYTKAFDVCERLTHLRPEHHAAWFGMAFYRIKMGAPIRAVISYITTAHRLAPESLTYRLSLVRLHAENKDYTAAYELLRPLAAEVIRCPLMVNRCIQIFAHVGDARKMRDFERWFERMAEMRDDHQRPTAE